MPRTHRLLVTIIVAFVLSLLWSLGVSSHTRNRSSSHYTLSTQDGLALTLDSEGRIVTLTVNHQSVPIVPGPPLWLRDLSRAGQVITPNLVFNPGFEQGTLGWRPMGGSTGVHIGVVGSPTHGGVAALAFTATLTTTQVAALGSSLVQVTPGQRYRISAWFRSSIGYVTHPAGTPPLTQRDIYHLFQRTNGLYILWLDEERQVLGSPRLVAPLHGQANRWRLIRGEARAPEGAAYAQVVIGARLEGYTLWVDDVSLVPSPEEEKALTGPLTPCSGQARCLRQVIQLEDNLTILVTYTAQTDRITVQGDVIDRRGEDRALEITWGIPLPHQGWIWLDDSEETRPITETRIYARDVSAIYDGWQPISLYPYAGIQQGDVGLGLGLPPNLPQLALLAYNGWNQRYQATFYLGISPLATRVGPHATFTLDVFCFDTTWGFRDVIRRHLITYARFYTTPRAEHMYTYAGRSQRRYYTEWAARQALREDAENVYSAVYISSDLAVKVTESSAPRPTMPELLAAVTRTVQDPYTITAAYGQAFLHSAVVDTNGEWSLRGVGIYPWDPDHWEASWAGNLAPGLEKGLGHFDQDISVAMAFSLTTKVGAHLDGVQIDNFMSNPTYDLRPNALAVTHWPLGYTPHTYQPAVHTGFTQEEFLSQLRKYLDTRWGEDRGITVNFWGLGHPGYLHRYIDGFGSEGNLRPTGLGHNWIPETIRYRRALAYHRMYLFANQTPNLMPQQAYTASQLALLYGVLSGRGPNGEGWDPEATKIISDTIVLVKRYWTAGWEPIPYARTNEDDVWVERFGTLKECTRCSLYFTIHNAQEITRSVVITLETTPLGINKPANVTLTDIAINKALPFEVVEEKIRFRITLGPIQTRIIEVRAGTADRIKIHLPLLEIAH